MSDVILPNNVTWCSLKTGMDHRFGQWSVRETEVSLIAGLAGWGLLLLRVKTVIYLFFLKGKHVHKNVMMLTAFQIQNKYLPRENSPNIKVTVSLMSQKTISHCGLWAVEEAQLI